MRQQRLYYEQPYLEQFLAQILNKVQAGKHWHVTLSQTAFYPTSGGQPCDLGFIDHIPVVDVFEQDGQVIHALLSEPQGTEVTGIIDSGRRLDHMQQHAGQHILSQAFLQLLEAETIGFHLSNDTVTIDLNISSLSDEQANKVELLANQVVWSNRPIKGHWVAAEELHNYPIRKPPTVNDDIRLIEVRDFDWSPCGGTHPSSTAEVGLIKLRRWERNKGNIRVEFLCGLRALRDYQWKNDLILQMASELSVKDRQVGEAWQRQLEQLRSTEKLLQATKEQLLEYEAIDLHSKHGQACSSGITLVAHVLPPRDFQELKSLAHKLTVIPSTMVVLVTDAENPQFLFARSADLDQEMKQLVKQMLNLLAGKGGGTSSMAQGSCSSPVKPEQIIAFIHKLME